MVNEIKLDNGHKLTWRVRGSFIDYEFIDGSFSIVVQVYNDGSLRRKRAFADFIESNVSMLEMYGGMSEKECKDFDTAVRINAKLLPGSGATEFQKRNAQIILNRFRGKHRWEDFEDMAERHTDLNSEFKQDYAAPCRIIMKSTNSRTKGRQWWGDSAARLALMRGCYHHQFEAKIFFIGHFSIAMTACFSWRMLDRNARKALEGRTFDKSDDATACGLTN